MNVSYERINALTAENARLNDHVEQLQCQLNDCEYALNAACADVSELQAINEFMHAITTDSALFGAYCRYFVARRAINQPPSPQHYSDTNQLYDCYEATAQ